VASSWYPQLQRACSLGRRVCIGDDSSRDKVIGERRHADGGVFGHRHPRASRVVARERGNQAAVIPARLLRPPRRRRKHRLNRVSRDAGHDLGKLWRVRGYVDQPVEFAIQPDAALEIATLTGGLRLVLDCTQRRQLLVGDVLGSSSGELGSDEGVNVRHVGNVACCHF